MIRKLLLLFLTITILSDCKKPETNSNSDCNFDSGLHVYNNILTESQQKEYLDVWKSILFKKSNMTDLYFNNHITKYEISSSEWNAGISFRIDYIMHIDWIDIRCTDNFLVKMKSTYDAYEYLNIPRDVFFDENQIDANISNNANSEISFYNLIEKLQFKDCSDLYNSIRTTSGYNEIKTDYAAYFVPGKKPRENGDPFMILKGTINKQENKCLRGYVNLSTGEGKVWQDACFFN